MDLVTYEAPLDNSFQKDRRELVNKGSLGRRRKPSRSNLKLILSPSSDQQDVAVLFNGHHHQNGYHEDSAQTNGISHGGLEINETISADQSPAKISNDNHRRKTNDPQLQVAVNNYKNVIASINQLQTVNGEDNDSGRFVRVNRSVSINCYRSNEKSIPEVKDCDQHKVNGRTIPNLESKVTNGQRSPSKDLNGNSCNRFSTTNGYRPSSPIVNHKSSNGHQLDKTDYQSFSSRPKSSFRSDDNWISSRRFSLEIPAARKDNAQCNQQHKVTANRSSCIVDSDRNGECNGGIKNSITHSSNLNRPSNGHVQHQPSETKYQQQVITFSNNRKIITSTPIPKNSTTDKCGNGNKNRSTPQSEPSLPRSSDTPNLVAEAQQFSIEAKLRRKKSEGRSAVLIQTWERRTQSSDSRGDPSKTNRFADKENNSLAAMPDSCVCPTKRGSLESDGLLSRARDASSVQSMLHLGQSNRFSTTHPSWAANNKVVVNRKTSVQEPEWISLSRKICAKFVEGHPGRTSPDSYPHEEPAGVSRTFSSPNESPRTTPLPKNPAPRDPCPKPPTPRDPPRTKSVLSVPQDPEVRSSVSAEPPWIHLSRKLCTKFIEEHIEYPPITNGHFIEVPELVEPNGDVRIIEKVGQPKSGRTKQKERQPEWVRLSKKLRAKFIESHLDDPETIALDNQLNVSDPEETSSTESLPEALRDAERQKPDCRHKEKSVYRPSDDTEFVGNHKTERRGLGISIGPPEKECCWEYQEMEFDQESNSGTFQETEHPSEPLQEARILRDSLPEDSLDSCKTPQGFCQEVSECFNRGVQLSRGDSPCGPRDNHSHSTDRPDPVNRLSTSASIREDIETSSHQGRWSRSSNGLRQTESSPTAFHKAKDGSQGNKLITVQFVSPAAKNRNRYSIALDGRSDVQPIKQSAIHGSFFNLSTWEETHHQRCSPRDSLSQKQDFLDKDLRSKSLDNLFDSLDGGMGASGDCCDDLRPSKSSSRFPAPETEEKGKHLEAFNTGSGNDLSNDATRGVSKDLCRASVLRQEESDRYSGTERYSRQSDVASYSENSFHRDVSDDHGLNIKKLVQQKERRGSEMSSEDQCMEKETGFRNERSISEYQNISNQPTSDRESDAYEYNVRIRKASDSCSGRRDTDAREKDDIQINEKYSAEYLERELNKNSRAKDEDEAVDNRKEMISQDTSSYGKVLSQKGSKSKSEDSCREALKKSDGKDKHVKCNGMIPNSIYSGWADDKISCASSTKQESGSSPPIQKEPRKLGMSKWITISRSEQNVNKVGNSSSNAAQKVQRGERRPSDYSADCNGLKLETRCFEKRYSDDATLLPSKDNRYPQHTRWQETNGRHEDGDDIFGPVKEFDLKNRCKSLCDVSFTNSLRDQTDLKHHESVDNLASPPKTFEFQHFEYESEIPLCAKLVSSQEKKKGPKKAHSGCSSVRTDSPSASETSHVYEDMFKETPSGPSDSEASSWTAVKNHSYYVNGRSSSMNDLDYSDSCSMSVKCDYESSSNNSTLQSRRSSHASSSFYVNLRDYDSHMLEPGLSNAKRERLMCNGDDSKARKNNPPTPESLRHLFTSPLNAIHSTPDRTNRLLNRIPSDPQSHYYSTPGAATSSAFKHGFAPEPPKTKNKKTERSSSLKIKDIAQGILLTFRKFHGHSKTSGVSSASCVDVSHLAEMNASKAKRHLYEDQERENCRTDTDSGILSDVQRVKPRRSSSDLTGLSRSNPDVVEKKKSKISKKNNKEKGKKSKSKANEARTIPTVSRKVQQGADGTLYLVTTVSGDTSALPGVYSDSPDTSSEISTHPPVRLGGESNC